METLCIDFNGHPWHQAVTIEVVDPGNPLVAFLGNLLQIEDEIYQISDFDYRGSHVLLRLDQSSVDLTSRPNGVMNSRLTVSLGRPMTGIVANPIGGLEVVRLKFANAACGSNPE